MSHVRRVVSACVLAALMAPPSQADDAARTVEKVQARYDVTADFTANVIQEVVVAGAGKTLRSRGEVAFKRPGKMRWILANHERQIIVADGKTLWFYQPEERQVLRAPFQSAFHSTTPISFLTGVGRIAEDFDTSIEERDEQTVHLRLRPRQTDAEIGQLMLRVDSTSYDITGAEIHDVFGNITRITFDGIQRNTGISDTAFAFEIPAGVDVIEAPIGY